NLRTTRPVWTSHRQTDLASRQGAATRLPSGDQTRSQRSAPRQRSEPIRATAPRGNGSPWSSTGGLGGAAASHATAAHTTPSATRSFRTPHLPPSAHLPSGGRHPPPSNGASVESLTGAVRKKVGRASSRAPSRHDLDRLGHAQRAAALILAQQL